MPPQSKKRRYSDDERKDVLADIDKFLDLIVNLAQQRLIPLNQASQVIKEVELIFKAAKGRKIGAWSSVLDVAAQLLKEDVSKKSLSKKLRYHDSTLHRALEKLEAAGFAKPSYNVGREKFWTINKERCPILYWITRSP